MATLIDASVLIAAERDALLTAHGQEEVALAAIAAHAEQLLSQVPVVRFDLLVARVHARLWARLAARGSAVGAHDLVLGTTAIASGARLATRDVRSFRQIPGLDIASW